MDVGAQLILARLALPVGHIRRQFVSFGVGVVAVVTLLASLLPSRGLDSTDVVGYALLHLLSYTCLGFCFFHVISLNLSSLRVRMLREYFRHHPHPLADEALMARYHVDEMLNARLGRLLSGHQIIVSADRFYSRRGIVTFIARLFEWLRALLLRS